ncbi:MAG: hypothetical protein RIC35_14020 [Marinoscillum sp.]
MINSAKRIRHICLLLMGMFFLGSCNLDQLPNFDNTYLPKYTGGIALLLVNDTLTIGEFLKENITDSSKYSITDDQQIIFSYEFESDFSAGDDLVDVNDFSNQAIFNSPITSFTTLPRDTSFSFKANVAFEFPATKDERLDSLYFDAADFVLTVISEFPSDIEYSFSTSSFVNRENGDTISIVSTIDAPTGLTSRDENTVSLVNHKTNLLSDDGTNQFLVNIDATVNLYAGDQLTGGEELFFFLDIENPQFEVIFGAFGQDTFDIKEKTVKLGFFEDLGGTGIVFESPRIEFTINNEFGIPMFLDFSEVYASYEDAEDLKFQGTFPENPQAIGTPDYGDGIVQSNLVVDASNSNLQELFAGSPTQLVLPLKGITNLDGSDNNFLASGSNIDFTAKVSMPLSVQMAGFEQEEEFEMEGLDALEGTSELSLVITTINELPFTGTLDLFFLDENAVRLDSIVGSAIFTSPTNYDSNGKVSEPSENRTEIVLDQELINSLTSSASIIVVTKLDSYGSEQGDFVEIFADYQLLVKVGVAGDVEIDLNDN